MAPKAKTGRPQAEIDEDMVKKLCEIQCTNREIASVIGVDVSTIERRFAGQLQGWRFFGHSSLRRGQWRKALYDDAEGDTVMLKHLGKVYLGQGDDSTEFQQRTLFEKFDAEMTKTSSISKPE